MVTLTLRRGQITAQGFHVPGEDAQFAITGGTGRYQRVGGVVSYSAAGIVVVIRIQYSSRLRPASAPGSALASVARTTGVLPQPGPRTRRL